MELLNTLLGQLSNFIWGPVMLTLLLGVGVYLTLGLKLIPWRKIGLGWSYYGERCAEFIFGIRVITPYRILWVVAILTGALIKLDLVWLLADVMNGFMAIPNLIALALLSPVIFRVTWEYLYK